MNVPTCPVPGCSGHLGKFADCLAQALWCLGEDYADESGGDSESVGYCMLFLFGETTWISSLAKDMFAYLDVPDFAFGPTTYVILTEVSSGQVSMEGFDNANDARAAYDAHDRAYGEWSEANDY